MVKEVGEIKKKRRVVWIVAIIILALVAHMLYCFSLGWAGALDGIKDVGVIIIILLIASVVLDRMTPVWRQAEIDQHAGEVSRLAKKFRKLDNGWSWDGNVYKREVKKSFKDDENNLKCYLLNYRRIPASSERLSIMRYAYHLGYYRRSLEYEELERLRELQEFEAEDQDDDSWFSLEKEQEIEQAEEMQMQLLSDKAKEEMEQRKTESTYETVVRYLEAGHTGKEIARNLGISEAMVSKYKKRWKKNKT